jgi:hypothetical protein
LFQDDVGVHGIRKGKSKKAKGKSELFGFVVFLHPNKCRVLAFNFQVTEVTEPTCVH